MKVTVKRIAAAECLPKRFQYEIPEGSSVRKLLESLSREYGAELSEELLDQGEIADGMLIMLNGLSLHQPDVSLDTEMKDGDHVLFSTMVYGG